MKKYEYAIRKLRLAISECERGINYERNKEGKADMWKARKKVIEDAIELLTKAQEAEK